MKVLIVDDEPLARNELHYLLNENALINQIDEADGVMTADQKVNAAHPDLVFLDIKLDDGNGMALARRWKKQPQPPAIVFATAYDNYAIEAFNEAAVDYVLKPFDPDRINEAVARVAKLLAIRNSWKTLQNRLPGRIHGCRLRLMTRPW